MATASQSPGYGAVFAGIQVASALLENKNQRQLRNVNQSLLDAQAASRNKVTAARNVAAGAEASLSSYIQSINNKRALDAGAKRQAAGLGALALGKEVDAANSSDRRQAAQQALGAAAAGAAFSGTVGGAPQRLEAALALRVAREDQRAGSEASRRSFYLAEQAGSALGNATAGQDGRTILPNVDPSIATAQQITQADNPLLAVLNSGADFKALIQGAGEFTTYLQNQFKSSPMPADNRGGLSYAAAGLSSPMPAFDATGLILEKRKNG